MKNIVTIVVITVVAVFAATGLVLRYGIAARTPRAAPAPAANVRTQAPPMSELDQLLAPVALYPDSLLAQMLMCTSDPQQVLVLNNWLKKQTKKGTALQDAAVTEGFDASFVALALFPQVVDWMAQRIDWTTQLGKAFAADRAAVFDSIQRLRGEAQKSGALKDTPQQVVETKTTSSGEQAIVIEPANPQVVYVPQYNPTVVYTQPATTTTVVVEKEDNTDEAIAAGLIGFTAGIAIGAAIDNDYYYGPYGWHGGGYMYNDAWDDYYDHREDAREDWMDHREDMMENRTDRANEAREQRGENAQNRTNTRSSTQSERQANRQSTTSQSRTSATSQSRTSSATAQTRTSGASTYESRGRSSDSMSTRDRSGTRSDAFSGYSSGSSTRAASSRGQSSRGSARRSGGGGRRR